MTSFYYIIQRGKLGLSYLVIILPCDLSNYFLIKAETFSTYLPGIH
jgi:hypothetical protein